MITSWIADTWVALTTYVAVSLGFIFLVQGNFVDQLMQKIMAPGFK